MTSEAKRLVGAKRLGGKRPGGNVLGAKRLGEEMVWGRNVPDSCDMILKMADVR